MVHRILLWAFTMVFLFLWALSTPYIASYLKSNLIRSITPIGTESLAGLEVIVVLAAGLKAHSDPDEDIASPYRVIKGVRVFKKTQAKLMIMSGRWKKEENNRMVIAMKKLAINMGVPEEQILLEPMARNTFEHAIFVSKLTEIRPYDRIGLVTSAWHMPRALKEFRRQFTTVIPLSSGKGARFPTGFTAWLPDAGSLGLSTAMIQEHVGMAWYNVRHWFNANDALANEISK